MAASQAAVLGSPIAHSLSPAMHNAAYAALGLVGWSYGSHQVDEAGLPGFMDALDDSWVGLSLTMPLKQAVIELLTEVDDETGATGSCNTVLLDGRRGFNTDVAGIVAALREAGVVAAAASLVLGGGATAASAVAAVARLGAPSVTVAVRDRGRAGAAERAAAAVGLPFTVVSLAGVDLMAADVVVSTLPAGAADSLATGVGTGAGVLLDVVYEPWPTALAAAWMRSGRTVVPGEAMLLHQAARQVTLMTGRPAPLAAMREALATERSHRRLIHQPG